MDYLALQFLIACISIKWSGGLRPYADMMLTGLDRPNPWHDFSVATSIRLLTEPGEGVIIPVPGYNRYRAGCQQIGSRPSI